MLDENEMLPDYGGASILNLMRSIGDDCGAAPLPYAPLAGSGSAVLSDSRKLVLLVIDGMGEALLQAAGQGTCLLAHRVAGLTSVFPSTTAAAVTTLLTGLAPARHGLTGWHMFVEQAQGVLAILPLSRRLPRPLAVDTPAVPPPEALFDHRGVFESMPRASHVISPEAIADSPFNMFHTRGARRHAYASREAMFECIAATALASAGPAYIHAYYDGLDALSHRFGAYGDAACSELQALDAGFAALVDALAGSGTTVVVTADHGFIDSPPAHWIDLAQFPDLPDMLSQPLCGEPRVAYCYVKSGQEDAFEDYVARHLGDAARCIRSRVLIEAGWFGPGATHPYLASRIGTHTLLMRDDWTIRDWLPGERRYRQIGVHGGVSRREMQVPLIIAQA